jgi:hypothetical protein
MHNRFFLWLYSYATPVQLDLGNLPPDLPLNDVRYYIGILQHVDSLLPGEGLTFVLTWHLDAFHEVMNDAVVLLIGDEFQQVPSYQRRVRALFKNGGVRRDPVRKVLRIPMPIAWRVLLRDARNAVLRAKRWWERESPRRIVTPMYEIPAGYHSLCPIDPMPIERRPLDVFFAGTSATSGGRGFWRASAMTRKMMTAALAEAQAKLAHGRVEWVLQTPGSERLSPEAYTEKLANAKIALAPRGNGEDGNRLIEGAKLGCVVVSEPLPARWYFQDCPAVILRKWSKLPEVLSSLLNDPARMKELSRSGRQWWDSTVSEAAVANYIAQQLTSSGRLHHQE